MNGDPRTSTAASEGSVPAGSSAVELMTPTGRTGIKRPMGLARLLFGLRRPVGPRAYLGAGVVLMTVKYLLQLGILWAVSGAVLSPLSFLSPLTRHREPLLQGVPTEITVLLVVLTLPFLWIGLSMSVRRATDAGMSPWLGLLFLLPFVNYAVMLGLAFAPSKPGAVWQLPTDSAQSTNEAVEIVRDVRSVLIGLAGAFAIGSGMTWLMVYEMDGYGATLFFGTPAVMGAITSFSYNHDRLRSLGRSVVLGMLAPLFGLGAMLLFAFEGLMCITMAAPIVAALGAVGAVFGWAFTRQAHPRHTMIAILALPIAGGAESAIVEPTETEVVTTIEIDAPPERVWTYVVSFSDLAPPEEWIFSTGIAYPVRARIDGEGVGAVRTCVFTTGPFVEPITAWDPPSRLAFDVVEQPPSMEEWSPFADVHPPHLVNGTFESVRGEFRLVPLPGGRTRLEGTTFYRMSMFPQAYWQIWSDELLHAIHRRVLRHIKHLSEDAH
jgi:uncharacterized membrane protein YhaH (DUF805 family)/uncharacterized protein YndB with AHSA1/START domain